MMHYGVGGFGGWGLIGAIFVPLFFLGVTAIVVAIGLWLWRGRGATSTRSPVGAQAATEILELRYARGELTREEFLGMAADLNRQG